MNHLKRSVESLLKMSQTLYAYFQKTSASKTCLPNPQGPLSKQLPSSCIESANDHVQKVTEQTVAEGAKGRKRGPYKKYISKDMAEVANYATLHGTSAAIRHFKARFPDLKWTNVNDWKEAMIKATTKAARDGQLEKIVVLEEKKRGRPSLLPDSVTADIKCYIRALGDAGGVVNTAIVLAAATGILQRKDPASLHCNGGHIILKKSWVKYLLKTMDFVKRRATTKHVPNLHNFDDLRDQYLLDIKAVVQLEEIPDSLIINWDQTGVNYVPVSEWTMYVQRRIEEGGGCWSKRQETDHSCFWWKHEW